jgi:hypothetical protein
MWKNFEDTALIPKRFAIAGSEYNVKFVNSSEDDLGGNYGDFSNLSHEIRIALNAKLDDEPIKVREDEVLKTYLHELGHCFNYYYNNECSEEFANAFSNFMYEYLHTKE